MTDTYQIPWPRTLVIWAALAIYLMVSRILWYPHPEDVEIREWECGGTVLKTGVSSRYGRSGSNSAGVSVTQPDGKTCRASASDQGDTDGYRRMLSVITVMRPGKSIKIQCISSSYEKRCRIVSVIHDEKVVLARPREEVLEGVHRTIDAARSSWNVTALTLIFAEAVRFSIELWRGRRRPDSAAA